MLGLVAFALALSFLRERPGLAQSVTVPAELQAELLGKLAAHDKSFADRAGSLAKVLILVHKDDVRSRLSATSMKAALAHVDRMGGLPHEETLVDYESGAILAKRCRAEHIAAVYVTQGLDGAVDDLRTALTGVDVLSVSAVADYVPRGIVLGFDLVSGKPKILLNYEQAKSQNVHFKADVLALMRVYR